MVISVRGKDVLVHSAALVRAMEELDRLVLSYGPVPPPLPQLPAGWAEKQPLAWIHEGLGLEIWAYPWKQALLDGEGRWRLQGREQFWWKGGSPGLAGLVTDCSVPPNYRVGTAAVMGSVNMCSDFRSA